MRNSLLFLALCQAALVATAHDVPARGTTARYACGGVGQLEQQQFKDAAPRHDAMLTFATQSGSYASDIDVMITSEQGRVVLQGFCDGPLMLLDVATPGRYRITATLDGHQLEKTVTLGVRSTRVLFTWPVS